MSSVRARSPWRSPPVAFPTFAPHSSYAWKDTLIPPHARLFPTSVVAALPVLSAAASGDLLMRLASNSTIREALASYTTSAILDGGLVVVFLVALIRVSPLFALAASAIALLEIAVSGRQHGVSSAS